MKHAMVIKIRRLQMVPLTVPWILLHLGLACGMPQIAATNIAFIQLPKNDHRRHSYCMSSHPIQHAIDVDIPIIYENDKLLAIEKPHNIPHHDSPSTGEMGLLSIIRHQQQQPNPSFPYPNRLYGVHRLDRVTSGILLLAKDPATASALMNKFQKKEIQKYYMAISGKKPKKKKQGWVKGIMTMGRRGSYKLVNASKQPKEADLREDGAEIAAGKKEDIGFAVTRFYTAGLGNLPFAATISSSDGGTSQHDTKDDDRIVPKTAILFRPHTGKTHQLRVAAKSVSLPILGDDRYGGGRMDCPADDGADEDDWDRTYLHASAIHFQLGENEDVTIWSPPPFGHLFPTANVKDVFVGLMEKHCDSDAILGAIRKDADSKING
mmetsp:Transcript_38309/g.65416  ORF Transcript_38309/g.65416 Transcript_38309/m.65416 type:complete len:379 (+) Transcript_38309:69-1205(+)